MADSILILGGTGVLGPAICSALLNIKHKVYLFNRGTNPERLILGVNHIKGDRCKTDDLDKLKDIDIDVVIDTMGWFPETLPYLIQILLPRIKRYIFISSVAVYCCKGEACNEKDKIVKPNPVWRNVSLEKRACEIIIENAIKDGFPAIILRLSHIYGSLVYMSPERELLQKLLKGQEIYVPDDGSARLQFVYYLDIVKTCVDIISNEGNGRWKLNCYNLTSDRVWTIHEWIIQFAEWAGIKENIRFEEFYNNKKEKFLYLPGDIIVDTTRIKSVMGNTLRCPDKSYLREVWV
jgi:Nucleoside-diphosphate-sugar epimerases